MKSIPCRIAFAALLLPATLKAQVQPAKPEDFSSFQRELFEQPDLLSSYRLLLDGLQRPELAEDREALSAHLATTLSMSGRYRDAEALFGTQEKKPGEQPTRSAVDAEAAEKAILRSARGHRVVMINEAHVIGRTRSLIFELLAPMRRAGFTHLAMETLSNLAGEDGLFDNQLPKRGYPIEKTGYYTREPIAGEIVREALRLGYTLVPYEYHGDDRSQQARETGQAQQLAALLRKQPKARMLVHVGHGHLNESAWSNGTRPMAVELKRMTGIDPLTIDQTVLWDAPKSESTHPAYQEGVALWRSRHRGRLPATAFVLLKAKTQPWSLNPALRDISVFAAPWTDDQPWRELGGKRVRRELGTNPCAGYPCLIEARYASESDTAIPTERALLDQAGPIRLWLRDGCYRINVLPKPMGANASAEPVCFTRQAGTAPATPAQ